MILLGSIERTELQAVFDWWLSPERRVFERGQSSPGQGSKVSWESFTFVDEGSREDSRDKVKGDKPQTLCSLSLSVMSGVIFFLLPQAAPVQEECNGPTASSKSQEPSTNHTGSGDLTFDPLTLHPLSPRPREDKPSLVFSLFSGCGVTSSENRKLATVRRTLQRLFSSSTSSSGQSEIQVLSGAQIDLFVLS